MSSKFDLQAILTMTDRLTGPMKQATASVTGFSNTVHRETTKANRSLSRTGDIIKGIIGANLIQAAGRSLLNAAEQGIELASALTEVSNVVDVTFRQAAPAINSWAKAATNGFGLSELQAKQFTGTLGAMMKSSGLAGDQLIKMSTDLAGLSGDFASFYNLPITQAFDKIKSAVSGETEPMKALGVNMSVANMQAFALSKGIRQAWSAMSQSQQTLLRYQYLMASTSDAQGDFARTASQSYAVQRRLLDVNVSQFLGNAMKKLLPFLIEGLKALNRFVSEIDVGKVADSIASAARGVTEAVRALWPHLRRTAAVLSFIAPVIPVLIAGFVGMKVAMLGLLAVKMAASFGLAVSGIVELSSVIGPAIRQMGFLKFVLGSAAKSQWLLNFAMMANPIGAIILAVTILAGAVAMLVMNLDAAKRKFMEITAFLDNPVIAALLSSIPGMDTALRVRQINQQQSAQGGGKYLSPGTTNTTTNRSQVDVNFNNTPKGTDIKQSGRPAPGATLNLGLN